MNQPNKLNVMDSNVWALLIEICVKALGALPGGLEPALLNFWAYRGGGKTTFLHRAAAALSASEVEVVGPWDVAVIKIEELIQEILQAVEGSIKIKKVILLDNLDVLLRENGGEAFFELERQLILRLLERNDVLLIATSQIPITQWREYDVRIRQENHWIPTLSEDDVRQIAEEIPLDLERFYALSLGYPQILSWLLEDPDISEKALAQQIVDYFLADLPVEVGELAFVASLLPVFDIAVLRDVLPAKKSAESEGLYADYVDRIRELIGIGLFTWDMQMGAYRFGNATVRRLLARSFQVLRPDDFEHIHQSAAVYYQAESRRAGYLHYVFVSALYHLARVQSRADTLTVGAQCRKWVEGNLGIWMGADWDALLEAWAHGGGDETVREELLDLLGAQAMNEITQLIEEAKAKMEVLR